MLKSKRNFILLITRSINLFRKIWWFIFRPTTIGVRLLLVVDDYVLLVKHSYGDQWYLPGGKIKSNENIKNGLKREVKEETGIDLGNQILGLKTNEPQLLGIYSNFKEYKNDYIFVFLMKISKEGKLKIKPDNFETEKIYLFDLKNLPDKMSPGTERRIQEFLSLDNMVNNVFIKNW